MAVLMPQNDAVPKDNYALEEANPLHAPRAEQLCEAAGSASAAFRCGELSNSALANHVRGEHGGERCQCSAFLCLDQTSVGAV